MTLRRTVTSPRSIAAMVLAAAVALTGVVSQNVHAAGDTGGPVYVARAFEFPDALAGSVLAAMNGGVLLLVRAPNEGDSIPDETVKELERRKPDAIFILGGTAAVSDRVANELSKYTTGKVERIEGATRFGTAAAIAALMPDKVADADRLDGKSAEDFASSEHLHVGFRNETATCPGVAWHPEDWNQGVARQDGSVRFVADKVGARMTLVCPLDLPLDVLVHHVRVVALDLDENGRLVECRLVTVTPDDPAATTTLATVPGTGENATPNIISRETTSLARTSTDWPLWLECDFESDFSDPALGLLTAQVTYEVQEESGPAF